MAFCINCGQELAEGAKFCAGCGKAVEDNNSSVERKAVYDGVIHKCPNCGGVLSTFDIICSSCGHELRYSENQVAVKELAERLIHATSEEQRIIIIKNFPIPNTKEDIFEFMLLASSNFDTSYYSTHLQEEDISDAWLTKIEQCYSKAKLSFGTLSDFEKIEKIYFKIKAECEEKIKRIEREQERAEKKKTFKKSKLRITIIIFAIVSALCVAVSFNDRKILSGIIAILMLSSFIAAFLMGSGVIEEKIRNMRLFPLVLAFVLFIPYFATYSNNGKPSPPNVRRIETIEWNKLAMGDKLPDYGKNKAEVVENNDRTLRLYFYNQTNSAMEDYVEKCKNFGYNIDVENDRTNFTAYNSEGYYLHLQWLDWRDKELIIDLENPKDRDPIIWPNSTLVKDAPVPNYLIGEVSYESDTSYGVYLVGVEKSYFDEYVSQCMSNGFNIDYSKSKTYFHGKNSDDISIIVEYVGFETLYIRISK